jgi:predicted phage-related endonuclease
MKDKIKALKDMGKLEIYTISAPKAETNPKKRSSMKDYLKPKVKAEGELLKKNDLLKLDQKMMEYLSVKREINQLEKLKKQLEGELDTQALDSNLSIKGLTYVYFVKFQEFETVISKEEVTKLGLLSEFKSRGFMKLSSRKLRTVEELK